MAQCHTGRQRVCAQFLYVEATHGRNLWRRHHLAQHTGYAAMGYDVPVGDRSPLDWKTVGTRKWAHPKVGPRDSQLLRQPVWN
jgi:hypothetical protein